jgi:hypothetical protein
MSKLYVKGHDGHFIRSIDLSCADESAAIESAKQLVDAPGSSRGPPVVGDPVSAVTEAEILPPPKAKVTRSNRVGCAIITIA